MLFIYCRDWLNRVGGWVVGGQFVGRGLLVVGCRSWVVGRGSWVVGRGSCFFLM